MWCKWLWDAINNFCWFLSSCWEKNDRERSIKGWVNVNLNEILTCWDEKCFIYKIKYFIRWFVWSFRVFEGRNSRIETRRITWLFYCSGFRMCQKKSIDVSLGLKGVERGECLTQHFLFCLPVRWVYLETKWS